MPRRSPAVALAAVALAVAVSAPPALATAGRVVPGRSISGFAIGQSRASLEQRFGAPQAIAAVGGGTRLTWTHLRMSAYVGRRAPRRVAAVSTTNRSVSLPGGVHIGSTYAEFHRAFRSASCTRVRVGGRRIWSACTWTGPKGRRTAVAFARPGRSEPIGSQAVRSIAVIDVAVFPHGV